MPEESAGTVMIVATDGVSLTNFRGPFIKYLVNAGNRVICVSVEPEAEMKPAISSLGAEYIQVAGNRVGIGVGDGIRMIREYASLFRKQKPDLCFFYMSKPTAFGSVAAVLTKTKHYSVLVNGLENAFYRSGAKDRLVKAVMTGFYRFAAKHADCVFFHNHDDLEYFRSHRMLFKDNAKVVGGSGVDMERFSKKPVPPEPVFLMVARLLWSKGIREFLEASEKVRNACPGARILLVGGLDSNDEAITEKELERYISDSVIEYCGYTDDVRPYLEECSVFVLPSYHEGLPRSVTEAMAVGRAVIVTDVPGCRETVADGENGFMVPVRDSGALAGKMTLLALDPELRASMGEASYRICSARFEAGTVCREMYIPMLEAMKRR